MASSIDFFQAQADAHRTTLRLIALFAGAVLALVLLTVLIVAAAIAWGSPPVGVLSWQKLFAALSPSLLLGVAGGVLAVVVIASLFRLLSLSRGGRVIAESLGGRPIPPNSDDPQERRLLNVVEEMSIASGVPVPPVYVIDEDGINAFAAGYGPDDAVLGVTRGTVELLDRSELQGVVAHEFSHILNGDMRLNIKLMSVLFGILVIGILGRSLIGGRRASSARSSRGSGTAQIAVVGLALMIVGYVGTFFGNLIKAAVSRQREFLADASAVQFTRDPNGIAGALRKIGGLGDGSRVHGGQAEEMSHMFFAQAVTSLFGRLLATHPPLDSRIRAVDPTWDGNYTLVSRDARVPEHGGSPASEPLSALHITDAAAGPAAATALGLAAAVNHAGRVTPGDVDRARALIDGLPRVFHDAVHEPHGARAAIYALLVADAPALRERQLELIDARADTGVPALVRDLLDHRPMLAPGSRLPLVQLAMPALKTLSHEQYARFHENLIALIKSDRSIALFEWVLHRVLLKELRPHFGQVERRRDGRASLREEREALSELLSALARTGHGDEATARAAFAAGAAQLEAGDLAWRGEQDPDFTRLNAALRRLRGLHPLAQPRLLKACARTVLFDEVLVDEERDLLHGIAAALDCPLPPLN
ncbi:MAG: M48 family metallopeptidase [Pseudomonadales bacterium]|jgi:Zn-dependent protease with chaperone function|nr:M48 family metallopeptidase [Pseudomonadales bacterium]